MRGPSFRHSCQRLKHVGLLRWSYAKRNAIILVDEYDQINRDFEPFWAQEPEDFLHRYQVMQERENTFTVAVHKGSVSLHGEHSTLRRAEDIGDVIERFSAFIQDDVNMTFIVDDQPAIMLDWPQRNRMLELAQLGRA